MIAFSASPHCHWAAVWIAPPPARRSTASSEDLLRHGVRDPGGGLASPRERVSSRHEGVASAEYPKLGDHHRDRADPRSRRLGIQERDLDLHHPGTGLVHHLVTLGQRLVELLVEEVGEPLLVLGRHLARIAPEEAHHDDHHLVVLGEHALRVHVAQARFPLRARLELDAHIRPQESTDGRRLLRRSRSVVAQPAPSKTITAPSANKAFVR